MTKLLSQLKCGGCSARFWPTADPFEPWVFCPACGAAHVRPDATGGHLHRVFSRYRSGAFIEWLERHWLFDSHIETRMGFSDFEARVVDGHHVLIAKGAFQGYDGVVYPPLTMAWIAAHVPSAADSPLRDWHTLDERTGAWTPGLRWPSWSHVQQPATPSAPPRRVGVPDSPCWGSMLTPSGVVLRGCARDDRERVAMIRERIAALASWKATPSHRIEEVEDPDPLGRSPGDDADAEARATRCARCGSPSVFEGLLDGARCHHCGATLELDEQTRRELTHYRARVAAQRQIEAMALDPAKLWSVRSTKGRGVDVSCASCGAPNRHQPGRLDETCAYCGALVLPSGATLARSAQANAAEVGGHVRSARSRAESRRLWGRRADARGRLVGALVVGVPTMAYFGLLAVAFALKIAEDPAQGVGLLFTPLTCLAVGPIVGGPVGLGLWWKRRKKLARWRRSYEQLAEQLGADAVGGLDLLRGWMEAEWHDVLPISQFGENPSQGCVVGPLAGFSVAMEAEPANLELGVFASSRPRIRRAFVAVACALPRDAPYWLRSRGPAAAVARLRACGFDVELHSGGVLVKAQPETIRRLSEDPGALAVLAPIAVAACQLAGALGGRPHDPAPSAGTAHRPRVSSAGA